MEEFILTLTNSISNINDNIRYNNDISLDNLLFENPNLFFNYIYIINTDNNFNDNLKVSSIIWFFKKVFINDIWVNLSQDLRKTIFNFILMNLNSNNKIIRDKSCKAFSFIFYLCKLNVNANFSNDFLNIYYNLNNNDSIISYNNYNILNYIMDILIENYVINFNNEENKIFIKIILFILENNNFSQLSIEIIRKSINILKYQPDILSIDYTNKLWNYMYNNDNDEFIVEILEIILELIDINNCFSNYLELLLNYLFKFLFNKNLIIYTLNIFLKLINYDKNYKLIGNNENMILKFYDKIFFKLYETFNNFSVFSYLQDNKEILKNYLKILKYFFIKSIYELPDKNDLLSLNELELNNFDNLLFLKLGILFSKFENYNNILPLINYIIKNIMILYNTTNSFEINFLFKNLIKNQIKFNSIQFFDSIKKIFLKGYILEISDILIYFSKLNNNCYISNFRVNLPFYMEYFILKINNDNNYDLILYNLKKIIIPINDVYIIYDCILKLFRKLDNVENFLFNKDIFSIIKYIIKTKNKLFKNYNFDFSNFINMLYNFLNKIPLEYSICLSILSILYKIKMKNNEIFTWDELINNINNYFSLSINYEIEDILFSLTNINKIMPVNDRFSYEINNIIFKCLYDDNLSYKFINKLLKLILKYNNNIKRNYLVTNYFEYLNFIKFYFDSYFWVINDKSYNHINITYFDKLKFILIKLLRMLFLELNNEQLYLDNFDILQNILLCLEVFINKYFNKYYINLKDMDLIEYIKDFDEDIKLIIGTKFKKLIIPTFNLA